MWAWMAIALVVAVGYYFVKKKSSGATTSSTAQTAATNNTPGGVDSSLVPQFVNQTYNQETPPAAPNVTVNNTIPTPPTVATPTPTATTTPPAKTISGAPGSYTTGLANGLNEWTSTGDYSLNTIAKSHGMTAQQLIASSESAENNTALKAYVAKGNYNAKLPSGVEIFIPNANWKTT
jgi:hypothetical protein